MAEEKLVYVVTDGGHSDYRIIAVFDDSERAEKFAISLRYNGPVAFTLNPELPVMRDGWAMYYVRMARTGKALEIRTEHSTARMTDKTDLYYEPRMFSEASDWVQQSYLGGYVVARNQKHAAKIANEKRAQLIASNEWPPDNLSGWEMEVIERKQRHGWRKVSVKEREDGGFEAVVHHAEYGTARASGDSEQAALGRAMRSIAHLGM